MRPPQLTAHSALHIRRRDTSSECNTTLPRVVSFVNCSLSSTPTALLLYTDERGKDYLRPLLRELQRVLSS